MANKQSVSPPREPAPLSMVARALLSCGKSWSSSMGARRQQPRIRRHTCPRARRALTRRASRPGCPGEVASTRGSFV